MGLSMVRPSRIVSLSLMRYQRESGRESWLQKLSVARSVPHPGPSLPNAHPWAPSPDSQEEVSLIRPALWVPGRGGQSSRACSEMHKSILSSERVKSRQKLSTTGAKHTEPPMAAMFRPGLNRPEEASHRHLTLFNYPTTYPGREVVKEPPGRQESLSVMGPHLAVTGQT